MSFEAQVGETIFLRDMSQRRHRWVVITTPNDDGKIVVVNFTDATSLQGGLILSPREWSVFYKETTVFFPDATLVDHKKLISFATENPGYVDENCPLDIVREILKWGIRMSYTNELIKAELRKMKL